MEYPTWPIPEPGNWPSSSPDGSRVYSASPATVAMYASRNRWKLFRHLDRINAQLLKLAGVPNSRLILSVPPRFGKSELCSHYLPVWWAGTYPGSRIVLASYEHEFATSWAVKARRTFAEVGAPLFGAWVNPDMSRQDCWATTRGSSVFATGVGGPLTGRGADLVILDDPIKNAEEANSEAQRAKLWEWFHAVLMTRLHEGGRVLVIGTRWHADDLIGRLLEAEASGGDRWDVINLPAIGDDGASLCPELFTVDTLKQRKSSVGEYLWETMFQGRPYVREGGFFRLGSIVRLPNPVRGPARRVRAWDLAASLAGDWTVGLLLAKGLDGTYTVEDVVRGRWRPGERDGRIVETARHDPDGTVQVFEEEGGSAGLAQIDTLRRYLLGIHVENVKHTGDKVVRAGPVASFAETGAVRVVEACWTRDFLAELEAFPNGKHDDAVDALSLGFNFLMGKAVGVSVIRAPERPAPCACGGSELTVNPFHAPWCPVKPVPMGLDLADLLDQKMGPQSRLWRN